MTCKTTTERMEVCWVSTYSTYFSLSVENFPQNLNFWRFLHYSPTLKGTKSGTNPPKGLDLKQDSLSICMLENCPLNLKKIFYIIYVLISKTPFSKISQFYLCFTLSRFRRIQNVSSAIMTFRKTGFGFWKWKVKSCMSYCRSSWLRENSSRRTWRNTMPRWQKLAKVRASLWLWLIAGITLQESHAGTVLKGGLGDHRNAFALMQVWSTFLKTQISSFLWSRVRRVAGALLKGNPPKPFHQLFV